MIMGKDMLTNGNHYGHGYEFGVPTKGYKGSSLATLFSPKQLPVESPPSPPLSPASSSPIPSSLSSASGFIEHRVSKLDTLAGIAIKYGVEVADIKRVNGLTSDLQLFALRSIRIPLPGKHSASPCLSNGAFASGQQSAYHPSNCHKKIAYSESCDLLDSFQSLKMKSSRNKDSYYGLKNSQRTSEGAQVAASNGMKKINYHSDGPFQMPYVQSDPLLRNKDAKGSCSCLFYEFEEAADNTSERGSGQYNPSKQNEILLKRRIKPDAGFTSGAKEKFLKEHRTKSIDCFSAITGKGLALRSKAGCPMLNECMEIFGIDSAAVRKFCGTSSSQDQYGTSIASIWGTSGWNIKPDIATAVISSSIVDGLPNLLTAWKNKAAID